MVKIMKLLKRYLIGFITGIIVCGTVSVIAAAYFPSNQTTYDNSNTGMSSTNDQGAIDELYNVCFPPKTGGDAILDDTKIVTSGEGLYADEYEEGKYTYKGKNVNNYVTFNNEAAGWRIISINSDGTIKIMRNTSIGNQAWDKSGRYGNNNWNRPATLNTYLNEDYYNSLTSIAKSQIVDGIYNVGGITDHPDMARQINDEKSVTSSVKVALPTLSEYLRANSNKNQCGRLSLNNTNDSICKNSNWMYIDGYWLTLSPSAGSTGTVFYVTANGDGSGTDANTSAYEVRPTITLSSDVQVIGGDGSQNNPFQFK